MKKTEKALCAIQWSTTDWLWLAEIAKAVGISRSEFVRRAALAAATATAAGVAPYFVGTPQATRQNTRTNLFESEGVEKSPSGEVRATGAAGVASAKGVTTKKAISRSPKG